MDSEDTWLDKDIEDMTEEELAKLRFVQKPGESKVVHIPEKNKRFIEKFNKEAKKKRDN